MIANAVRGRPPLPARKLQVCRPAGGAANSQRRNELAGAGPALELHPLAHGGEVGDAHTGGRAEPVTTGATTGGTRRRGASGGGKGHDRFCLSRRGKIAETDVRACDWWDWSDAPGQMDACYPLCDLGFALPDRYCPCVLRIGLTGGIGSGKSTVSALLADEGAVIVDADRIAREVVEPGTPGLAAVVDAFGERRAHRRRRPRPPGAGRRRVLRR